MARASYRQGSVIESDEHRRVRDAFALGNHRIGRKALVRPTKRDAFHDDLVIGDAGVLAHHGRLHDSLAVDDAAKAPRPSRVDKRGGHRAAIERGVVAAIEGAVVGDDDAHGSVELAEATHDPIVAHRLVVACDAHGREQLLGNADLALAMLAREGLTGAKFARLRYTGGHSLRVAMADAIERLARDDVEVPGLRVHRRRCPHGEPDDLLDERARDRVRLVSANAAAAEDDLVELHVMRVIEVAG